MSTRPVSAPVALGAYVVLLVASPPPRASAGHFAPYGFQSGAFRQPSSQSLSPSELERINDDSYAASIVHDAQHNLVYFTGMTYGTFFDSALPELSPEVKGAMGMSYEEGGRDVARPHLESGDCFLGILKLPRHDDENYSDNGNDGSGRSGAFGDDFPWLINTNSPPQIGSKVPKLIYSRRFGTPQNSETCSSILMLPKVSDALLQTEAQLKLALLGHVNPAPLSSAELNAMGPVSEHWEAGQDGFGAVGGGERLLRSKDGENRLKDQRSLVKSSCKGESIARRLDYNGNSGGLLHSLSGGSPITEPGRAYGFVLDFDVSLTLDETFTTATPPSNNNADFNNAYGALLGGYVLESSPLVYPVAIAQNSRDRNQVYVVSMHSDEDMVALGGEYAGTAQYVEFDGRPLERADTTLGGAGLGDGSKLVGGGVPKFGTDFYVKVQQLTVMPYEQLMEVEPTHDERVKRTMTSGWGFGFKLNDADDVRPSAAVFVKGRTPDEDLLLVGGTTRKKTASGVEGELDGFITKLIPPAPSPVADATAGHDVADAIEVEGTHPTKRIDSTMGRDETVTAICIPPPDLRDGIITHAFVVGSTSSDRGTQASGHEPSLAYILRLRLDDLSIEWKEHVPSIHPTGLGGDVLGEGCAVSPDGRMVYLAGTIDGGSALNTGVANMDVHPIGGKSDIFVVAYDVAFGNVQWARQLGSVHEDKLARGGGVVTDDEGNVLVMGTTRGGLQRYRREGGWQDRRMLQALDRRPVSDVFIMSLAQTDGAHINAPYTGGKGTATGALGGAVATALPDIRGGLWAGAIVGILLVATSVVSVMLFFALRYYRHKWPSRKQWYGDDGNVVPMWEHGGGDDFSFGNGPLGGRGRIAEDHGRPARGTSENDDKWDNGAEMLSKNATWMISGDGSSGDDDGSVHSAGSTGSGLGFYTSKQTDDNVDFLSSLRKEANTTMTRMFRDTAPDVDDGTGETTDPRLDGGASIKSLLTHYREVKKGGLIEGGVDKGGKVGMGGILEGRGSLSPGRQRKKCSRPPPSPGCRNGDREPTLSDGLSEFTII